MGFWDFTGGTTLQSIMDPGQFTFTPKNPGTQYQDRGDLLYDIGVGVNRSAPQLDPTQQAQFRDAQMRQMQQLQGIASGQQQGAGELATQRQVQNAMAAQQAQARMARGGQNAALAMRQGARNSAGIGLSGAGQSQQAAMQDQMNAQGLLANVAGQGRQQDLGLAGQNAQLQQGQNQLGLGYDQLLGSMDQAQLAAAQQAYQNQMDAHGRIMGGSMAAGGSMMSMMSDERLKTDIAPGGDDIDRMLSALTPKRYRYKDEKHGKGPRVGVMAQDMAKSKAGRDVVVSLPDGLGLDVNKALSAALASAARLHERLSKVEKKAA